jgi:hypothetical protein
MLVCAPPSVFAGTSRHGGAAHCAGANPESQEHDRTALGFALHPWAYVHDLGSAELLLRQDAKAEADFPLNDT